MDKMERPALTDRTVHRASMVRTVWQALTVRTARPAMMDQMVSQASRVLPAQPVLQVQRVKMEPMVRTDRTVRMGTMARMV
jgi:hypothetical protein